jgi:Leucine-rich repeat (LRR) protein
MNDSSKMFNLLKLTLDAVELKDDTFISILDHIPSQILKELHVLRNPRLTCKSYTALAQKMSSCSNDGFKAITKLSLESNAIEDKMVEVLCSQGLQECQSLSHLNLSNNNIKCRGAEWIAKLLNAINLKSLLLHWNDIRGKGAMHIYKALKAPRALRELDLSFNSISKGEPLKKKSKIKVYGKEPPVKEEKPQRRGTTRSKSPTKSSSSKPRAKSTQPEQKQSSPTKAVVKVEQIQTEAIYKLGKLFVKNQTLEHLDISFNDLQAEDIKYLST